MKLRQKLLHMLFATFGLFTNFHFLRSQGEPPEFCMMTKSSEPKTEGNQEPPFMNLSDCDLSMFLVFQLRKSEINNIPRYLSTPAPKASGWIKLEQQRHPDRFRSDAIRAGTQAAGISRISRSGATQNYTSCRHYYKTNFGSPFGHLMCFCHSSNELN